MSVLFSERIPVLSRLRLPLQDIRFAMLRTAILIYACIGSPTPDHFGYAEFVVAVLLVIAAGAQSFIHLVNFSGKTSYPLWYSAGRLCFFALCFLGVIQFIVLGNYAGDALRDFIAVLFLFLPVIFYPLVVNRTDQLYALINVTALAGMIFALRSLSVFDFDFLPGIMDDEPLSYLANAPTVLFCAIYLMLGAVKQLEGRGGLKRIPVAFLLLIMAVIPCLGIILTMQRASIALLVIVTALMVLYSFYIRPYKYFPAIVVIALTAAVLWPILNEIITAFAYKTRIAGDNMRLAELGAIWSAITAQPLTLFFGLGFGGNFESPAVGNYTVNFAHGLLSAALLKGGLLGITIIIIYLALLFRAFIPLWRWNMVLFLALSAPFFICVVLYASYKSLDFGLILTLMAFAYTAHSGEKRNSD
ncbi:MAG: hypothetical protein ACLFR0_08575 [Alphaproteobacteria bacterium]